MTKCLELFSTQEVVAFTNSEKQTSHRNSFLDPNFFPNVTQHHSKQLWLLRKRKKKMSYNLILGVMEQFMSHGTWVTWNPRNLYGRRLKFFKWNRLEKEMKLRKVFWTMWCGEFSTSQHPKLSSCALIWGKKSSITIPCVEKPGHLQLNDSFQKKGGSMNRLDPIVNHCKKIIHSAAHRYPQQ